MLKARSLLTFLFFGLIFSSQSGWAAGTVCIADPGSLTLAMASAPEFTANVNGLALNDSYMSGEMAFFGAPQCRTLKAFEVGMEVISIGLGAGSIYAACTVVGAPFSVALAGGALGAQALNLVVSNLPCDDSESEARVKAAAQAAVCEALAKNGIACAL